MNVVRLFQDFQKIYGLCPCCGEPFRLSEAALFHRAEPPSTVWDELKEERGRVARAWERFEEQKTTLQEEAREAGRQLRDRRLRRLTAFFRKRKIALADLKLIFHPVDYVVFRGLRKQHCAAVEFIDRKASSKAHERLQRSIKRACKAGNVDWVTLRIDDAGRVSCK